MGLPGLRLQQLQPSHLCSRGCLQFLPLLLDVLLLDLQSCSVALQAALSTLQLKNNTIM